MKRPHQDAFQTSPGHYIGKLSYSTPYTITGPGHLYTYSKEEALEKQAHFEDLFPGARIVPAPRWNTESREYETPIGVPHI